MQEEEKKVKRCLTCGWFQYSPLRSKGFCAYHFKETRPDDTCEKYTFPPKEHEDVVGRLGIVLREQFKIFPFVRSKYLTGIHMPDKLINLTGDESGWLAIEYIHSLKSLKRDIGGLFLLKHASNADVVAVLNLGLEPQLSKHFTKLSHEEMKSFDIPLIYLDEFIEWLRNKRAEKLRKELNKLQSSQAKESTS